MTPYLDPAEAIRASRRTTTCAIERNVTLQPGQRIKMGGEAWRVLHVNESRAFCRCENRQEVTVNGATFVATSTRTANISPNSVVEILSDDVATVIHRRSPTVRGWRRSAVPTPVDGVRYGTWFHTTSLAARVMAYIVEHPGATAEELHTAIGQDITSYIQRFAHAGMIEEETQE